MSLNGLDAPHVQQAYDTAISEAGGWFFLKYVSRDEVDLLAGGKAGVSEARAAIAQYDEPSPLYGLLVYRRRKVLVKYVPQGTSRLLQARTTVHLRDVQARYSPYETMLEVTTADGVSDTALAAAFPLHTASPALSSSNQLNEITEDSEDGDTPKPLTHSPPQPSRRPGVEKRPSSQRSYRSPTLTSAPFGGDLKQKSSLSQFLIREELGHKSVTPLNEYQASEDTASTRGGDTASISSQRTDTAASSAPSVRPSTTEPSEYDLETYLDQFFKPKIKLGPRPVNVTDKGKRATTASVPLHTRSRPNSIRDGQSQKQHSAAASIASGPPRIPSLHFSPHIPDVPDFLPPRPSSIGSSRSLPASRASKSHMTPEKQRLMKALEMRRKQMRNSTPAEETPAMPSPRSLDRVPEMPTRFPQAQVQDIPLETKVDKADSGINMDGAPFTAEEDQHPVAQNHPRTEHLDPRDTPEVKDKAIIDSPTLGFAAVMPSISEALLTHPETIESRPESDQTTPTEEHKTPTQVEAEVPEIQPDNVASDEHEPGDTPQKSEDDESKRQSYLQMKRRRGLIECLHIDIAGEARDADHSFLSDEDFMEELQTATLEEATPIAMSRSPASPFFPPRRPSGRSVKSARSITTSGSGDSIPSVPTIGSTLDRALVPPELLLPSADTQSTSQSRTPSVSSVRTPDSERSDPVQLMRKSNVSSGISRRIQALTELSSRDGSPPVMPGSRQLSADHNMSIVSQRKSSLIDTTDGWVAAAADNKPKGRLSPWPIPAMNSANPTNTRTRRGPASSRDSVSVTARIVRVPRAQQGDAAPELQASPLLINHTRPTTSNNFPPMDPLITDRRPSDAPDFASQDGQESLASPISRSSVDSGATSTRKSFDRKSLSRLRGPESPKKGAFKQSSTMSTMSESSPDKASRTSRFFKRISHLGGNNKRKSVPPQVPEVPTITKTVSEPLPEMPSPSSPVPSVPAFMASPSSKTRPESIDVPPPVSVGDLNVQFPDTMLWKRRWVEIDSTGNLIFTAARHSTHGKAFNSKFHLKELSAPFIPDIDMQEMPNSVLLDIVQGEGSLQLASEDAMSQRQLLSLLTTYYHAWTVV